MTYDEFKENLTAGKSLTVKHWMGLICIVSDQFDSNIINVLIKPKVDAVTYLLIGYFKLQGNFNKDSELIRLVIHELFSRESMFLACAFDFNPILFGEEDWEIVDEL